MPRKVFISFRGEDEFKVWTLRNLARFQNVDFEMDDVSLRDAIDSQNDTYIRSVIRPKIKTSQICLCLIGENTFRSRKWVPWEVGLAVEEGKTVIGMRFWDTPTAGTPSVLTNNGIRPFNWDLDKLYERISR